MLSPGCFPLSSGSEAVFTGIPPLVGSCVYVSCDGPSGIAAIEKGMRPSGTDFCTTKIVKRHCQRAVQTGPNLGCFLLSSRSEAFSTGVPPRSALASLSRVTDRVALRLLRMGKGPSEIDFRAAKTVKHHCQRSSSNKI